MTPIETSLEVINRIKQLNKQKEKELSFINPIKMFRRKKIKDIDERLGLNWKWLYEFYPNLCGIKHVETFEDLITCGYLENRIRFATVGAKSFAVGNEWSNYLKARQNEPDPYEDMIGGPV